jgi:hypothetical protein
MERKTGLTSEDVWAMIAQTSKQLQETDRLVKELRESGKETDRRMQETDKQMQETDRRMQKLQDKLGGIDDNLGYHAEQFFQDALAKSKTFGGVKYDLIISNMKCEGKGDEAEFDIVLVNGKSVAIIEVKNRIHPDFVEKMAKDRVDKFRKYFKVYERHKAYLGIAGFSFSKKVLEKARECGIGIIKQVGNSIEIDANKLKAY